VTIARCFTSNDFAIHCEGLYPFFFFNDTATTEIYTQLDRAVEYLNSGK
jgi:hypothetical protein